MADDFSNLRNLKKPKSKIAENSVDPKLIPRKKASMRVCFIITKNKNNSWVEDLHALAQLNEIERVYH